MGDLRHPEFIDPELSWFLMPMALLVLLLFFLALCDGWPDVTEHPVDDNLRPHFLHRRNGDLDSFLEGPPKAYLKAYQRRVKLQEAYLPNRMHLYANLLRTAPARIWKVVFLSGSLSMGMTWSILNGLYFNHVELATVFRILEVASHMLALTLPLCSCLLGFHVHLKMRRFNHIVNQVGQVSGDLEEIALMVGCSTRDRGVEKSVIAALWTLYRHLNLVHILTYMQISRRFEHITVNDIFRSSFINEKEMKSLKACMDLPGLATLWISHVLMELQVAEVFDAKLIRVLTRTVSHLRGSTTSLIQEVKRKPPVALVLIVQLNLDASCMLTPFALLHTFLAGTSNYEQRDFPGRGSANTTANTTNTITETGALFETANHMMFGGDSRWSIYLMPLFGSMLFALLYQGTYQIVKDTADPFGVGMDSLNPDSVLNETERRISLYLRKDSETSKSLHTDMVSLSEVDAHQKAIKESKQTWWRGSVVTKGEEAQARLKGASGHKVRATVAGLRGLRDLMQKDQAGQNEEESEDNDALFDLPQDDLFADFQGASDENSRIASSELGDDDAELPPDGREALPTSVVFSMATLDTLAEGAHQDAKDLHKGVQEKLLKVEDELLQRLEEDDPYLVAVTKLIPQLQQDAEANAGLRTQVVNSVARLQAEENQVLLTRKNQRTATARLRSKDLAPSPQSAD